MNGDRPTLRWFDVMVVDPRARTTRTVAEHIGSAAQAFTVARTVADEHPEERVLVGEATRTYYLVERRS